MSVFKVVLAMSAMRSHVGPAWKAVSSCDGKGLVRFVLFDLWEQLATSDVMAIRVASMYISFLLVPYRVAFNASGGVWAVVQTLVSSVLRGLLSLVG